MDFGLFFEKFEPVVLIGVGFACGLIARLFFDWMGVSREWFQ